MQKRKNMCDRLMVMRLSLLAVFMLLILAPYGKAVTVNAAAVPDENGFVIEDDVLTDYKGNNIIVDVPYGVREIGSNAFKSTKETVERINLPDSVCYIDKNAFDGCTGLTTVSFSYRVKTIGAYAFRGCTNLQSVNLSATKIALVDNSVFYGCSNLTSVVLPDTVTMLGQQCFGECERLGRINIPEGVKQIQYAAFRNCHALSTIELPDSLDYIGDSAFSYCIGMSVIKIPAGVTILGNDVFGGDYNLEKVYLPDTLKMIHNQAFDTMNRSNPAKGSLTSIYIPTSVEYFDNRGLQRISGIKEIQGKTDSIAKEYTKALNASEESYGQIGAVTDTITYTEIKDDAVITFDACGGVLAEDERTKSGVVGQTYGWMPVPKLAGYDFAGWYSDKALKKQVKTTTLIQSGAVTLYAKWNAAAEPGEEIYAGKSNDFTVTKGVLKKYTGNESVVIIPDGVTEIDASTSCFKNKTFITKIVIPDSVTVIDTGAFQGCNNLMELNIPKGVTIVPQSMCLDCFALESIIIPDGVTEIGVGAFSSANNETMRLRSVSLPKGLVTLNKNVFKRCRNLTEIRLPESLETIGQSCFDDCISVQAIDIPAGVKELPKQVFSNACSLKTITLNEGLTTIGSQIISGNRVLEKIYIPDTAAMVDEGALDKTALSEITIVGKASGNAYLFYEKLNNKTLKNSDSKTVTLSFEPVDGQGEISFDTGIEGLTVASRSIYVGLPYGTLPVINEEGKIFVGWSTDGTTASVVATNDVPVFSGTDKKLTLKAVWRSETTAVDGEPIVPEADDDTPKEVIEIGSAADLSKIRNDLAGSYKLTADIVLSGLTEETDAVNIGEWGFIPIGVKKIVAEDTVDYSADSFTGVFDGNGHTISGLSIKGDTAYKDIGLFARVKGGVINNLTLENVDIEVGTDSVRVGSLAGYVDENASGDMSEITDIIIKSGMTAMTADEAVSTNNISIGGVIGYVGKAKVSGCKVLADVKTCYLSNAQEAPTSSCSRFIGGIAGYLNNGGVISQCSNDGVVSGYRNFVGIFNTAKKGDFVEMALKGTDDVVVAGGILGVAAENGTVEQCCNTGEVAALMVNEHTLFDLNVTSHFDTMAGGIVGTLYKSTAVMNCYNTGYVKSWSTTETHLTLPAGYGDNLGLVTMVLSLLDEYTLSAPVNSQAIGYAAGIVGYSTSTASGPIMYCYNKGSLSGQIGIQSGSEKRYVYGIANGSVPVAYCRYAAMTMTDKGAGEDGADVTYTLTGTPNGESLSTSKSIDAAGMTKRSSYRGFDFNGIWFMVDENDEGMTPILCWQAGSDIESVEFVEDADNPVKTEYAYGEAFDLTGLSVKIKFADRETPVTLALSGSGNTNYNPYKAGEQRVVVEYLGVKKEFTVTVSEITYALVIEKGTIADSSSQGSISGYYAAGKTVAIKADPADDYTRFDKWTVVSGKAEIEDATKIETTVTTTDRDTQIVAEYVKAYKVQVENGMIIEVNGAAITEEINSGFYATGDMIKVRANDPAEGKQFKAWNGKLTNNSTASLQEADKAEITYTMGERGITLYALYEDIPDNGNAGGTGTGDGTNPGGSTGTGDGTNPGGSTGTGDDTSTGGSTGTGDNTNQSGSTETGETINHSKGETIVSKEDGATYNVTEDTSGKQTVEYNAASNTSSSNTEKTVVIPEQVTIDNVTYQVTSIANNAFKNNSTIETVKISDNIVSVGNSAFANCSKLKKVEIGAKVETIGAQAFANCKKLNTVTIGKSVKKIGKKAFYGDKKISKFTINTSKLTASSVGKNAFSKTSSKMTVKVPKKKVSAYKKLLVKKGLSKKAKVKK
ncbi:MAG: leucine-rich repeat protein [Lachnospiraceae bacterium]|nr:leucine-rich repeat protein [Lachnospiraceae bacterium]